MCAVRGYFVTTAVAIAHRNRHLRSLHQRVVVVTVQYVLWRNPYVVLAQRRRVRLLWPLIARLYT